ncbi:hypothetical protein Ciccas_013276 [Cichlidogyrus casuarinus]|uniref:Fibronectin type-III domain-containing protein n=1 Tax=Cichlidogyrus casuarinus TaxID=1844966 RepID=A0ABD2PMT8_9PLAT
MDEFNFAVSVNATATSTSVTIGNLFACTKYLVTVTALSKRNPPVPGEPSDPVPFSTDAEKLEMTSVSIRQKTPTSFTVSIVGKNPVCESVFVVKVIEAQAGVVSTVEYKERPDLITGLVESNTYRVSVAIKSGNTIGRAIESTKLKLTPGITLENGGINIKLGMKCPLADKSLTREQYSAVMSNKSHPIFIAYATNLCKALKTFIENSGEYWFLPICRVVGLQPGSIVAEAELIVEAIPGTNTTGKSTINFASIIAKGVEKSSPKEVPLLIDTSVLQVNATATSSVIGNPYND